MGDDEYLVLTSEPPSLSLTNRVIDSQVYGQPPDALQRPGATPLGDAVKGKLEFLTRNNDRMNQVVWAAGNFWCAVNTVVKTPNGPTRVGIAYFAVTRSVRSSGQAGGTIAKQGYLAVNQESVMFPSIAVHPAGEAVVTSPSLAPTTTQAPRTPSSAPRNPQSWLAARPRQRRRGLILSGGHDAPRHAEPPAP